MVVVDSRFLPSFCCYFQVLEAQVDVPEDTKDMILKVIRSSMETPVQALDLEVPQQVSKVSASKKEPHLLLGV